MRHLAALSEQHVIAAFLQGELPSARFGGTLAALLHRDGLDRSLIEKPDLTNEAENAVRLKLLGDFRGYGQNRELFHHSPDDVAWHRYAISREELAAVRYIDYSYWNELSGGSRRPADAALAIRSGKAVFGQGPENFLNAAGALEKGAQFPELILVGTAPGAELVVLEGHVRLTAYALAPARIPADLTALIGFSPALSRWMAL